MNINIEESFSSFNNLRFLELHSLLKNFLNQYIFCDKDYTKSISKQLLNVLKNCDDITYEEPGTAEAYALLHFLDRYHRFQIIFDILYKHKYMPLPPRKIDILDVGTGPGPSMYAVSDFYTGLQKIRKRTFQQVYEIDFSIDYVERSSEFRNWLHHFTEYVNYYCESQIPWRVPYHHGTFVDFQGLDFNQRRTYFDYDDDGDYVFREHIEKYRYDLVVFSNFLTTKEQVSNFSNELKNCVRNLRNKGILVVVGAKSSDKKYSHVYEEISNAILSEDYNNWKFIATCEKLDLNNSAMSYTWNDFYGEKNKDLIRAIYDRLKVTDDSSISPDIAKILEKTIKPDYSKLIDWEIHIFRKRAKMRKKNPFKKSVERIKKPLAGF